MKKTNLNWTEVSVLLKELQTQINKDDIIYGIPKGGMIVSNFLTGEKTMHPQTATIFVDDIEDSGETKKKWTKKYPDVRWLPMLTRKQCKDSGYIIFPWENEKDDKEHIITKLIEAIGEDPKREGLRDTPKRVIKSWETLYGGYSQTSKEVLQTVFTVDCDEMIILKDIEFYSTCEHHLLPFFGKAHIAYIPRSKVVGLSKLSRLLEVYARRLQIQERLTNQIADDLMSVINPLGVGVIIEAKHFCMISRGVQKRNPVMTTSAIRGLFKSAEVKNEFHRLCK